MTAVVCIDRNRLALEDIVAIARGTARPVLSPDPAFRAEHGALAADLHRLHQAQIWGRFVQGLKEPFR